MNRTLKQLRHDDYVTGRQIRAYQELVIALSEERNAIRFYGAFSSEARITELATIYKRKLYEIWRKK